MSAEGSWWPFLISPPGSVWRFLHPPGGGAADELALLLEADRGDSEAQSDVALLCLQQGRADIAFYWFNLAAQQGHADAMHYLSELYQKGYGVEQCESTAMLWRAKAAGAGHVIARAQMLGVTSRRVGE